MEGEENRRETVERQAGEPLQHRANPDRENLKKPGQDTAVDNRDVEALIRLLDGYNIQGGSRMKIDVVDGNGAIIDQQHHLGRCDIGSPFAAGKAYDVNAVDR